jgi:hypothetical protein
MTLSNNVDLIFLDNISIIYPELRKLAINSGSKEKLEILCGFLKTFTDERNYVDYSRDYKYKIDFETYLPQWIDVEIDTLTHKINENVFFLDWEILPPEWWLEPEYRRLFTDGILGKHETLVSLERLDYMQSLKPFRSYRSKFGGREFPYYAFMFSKCVVAECPVEGNAIYIIRDMSKWDQLLQLPKRELRLNHSENIRKINHYGDWRNRLRNEIA